MAVTLVKTRRDNTGEIGKDASFAIDFEVHMEDGDGIITAMNADGLPAKGSLYNWNGETHPAAHTIKRAKIVKATPEKVIALVTCDYELKQTDPDESDPGGNPTTDPAQVQFVLTPGFRTVMKPVRNAEFLGYYDADGAAATPAGTPGLTVGQRSPISNSASIANVPVWEEPKGQSTLTFSRYFRNWNIHFDLAHSKVNRYDYLVNLYDGTGHTIYYRQFSAEELFLYDVKAEQRQFGPELWYWVTVEFWIGDWNQEFPDEGLTEIVYDPSDGNYKHRSIRDRNGNAITEPVLFDGTGKPIAGTPQASDAIYLRWKTKGVYNFNLLDLPFAF